MKNIDSNTIALIGGGPAALLVLKNIFDSNITATTVHIFEKNDRLGVGMPYGKLGASKEHVANVSANELPHFEISFEEYLSQNPTADFPDFSRDGKCNPYQVIPRLLLGNYLEFNFKHYTKIAKKKGIKVITKTNSIVDDIIKINDGKEFKIIVNQTEEYVTHKVILCTGHYWPKKHEDDKTGWYDSPYPPSKFQSYSNHPIAIRGTSLTAVDAVKTHSRLNGKYEAMPDGQLKYTLNEGSENFRIDMFSTGGFLPALRFHSEDEAYSNEWTMSLDEIYDYKKNHNGFVDLDYVFEINFKKPLKQKDPDFHQKIKDLSIEEFVAEMMTIRKELDSFQLFKAEYTEAEKSIKRHQSVSWKEALSAFSYSMNYPAKHFSAEDMTRLRKTLLPLISIIIASLPQSSYKEIIALYDAGIIDLIQVDKESFVEPHTEAGGIYHYKSAENEQFQKHYQLYIDAVGQQPLEVSDLPFASLRSSELVSAAYLNFKENSNALELQENSEVSVIKGQNDNYYMKVHGLEINDYFQSLDTYGQAVDNLFIMAVPFIGGLNPDYSGLDFCDTAASRIVMAIK
ncbi:FAD/NAD(P)-binding protein [Epilithonimonas sp. JDS]|uniref:FAD/NAD(P)-binding protein n=1 Tax=Epilithonimonas sp. JDS TaxID=2902797 RepID=UPI001E35545F|nr:FAD/NAD(P)-binding protein [Epilithonimonas sp. JDS]MCD9854448.1 FAD/NAD(P)-binding protein [Epilithonimonas sp. JDS]